MRDEKEGRKKQARSNQQQDKATCTWRLEVQAEYIHTWIVHDPRIAVVYA